MPVFISIADERLRGLLTVCPPLGLFGRIRSVSAKGSKRTVVLMDGTHMSLNTSTRVRVALASE